MIRLYRLLFRLTGRCRWYRPDPDTGLCRVCRVPDAGMTDRKETR